MPIELRSPMRMSDYPRGGSGPPPDHEGVNALLLFDSADMYVNTYDAAHDLVDEFGPLVYEGDSVHLAVFSAGWTKIITAEFDTGVSWFLRCYEFDILTGIGAFVNEVNLGSTTNAPIKLVLSPNGQFLIARSTGNVLYTYKFNETAGLGSSITKPSELTGGLYPQNVVISPDSAYVIFWTGTPDGLTAYPISMSTGYGTAMDPPASPPSSFTYSNMLHFIDSTHLAFRDDEFDVGVYEWDDRFYGKLGPYTVPNTADLDLVVGAANVINLWRVEVPYNILYQLIPITGFEAAYADPVAEDWPDTYDLMFPEDKAFIVMNGSGGASYLRFLWTDSTGPGTQIEDVATAAIDVLYKLPIPAGGLVPVAALTGTMVITADSFVGGIGYVDPTLGSADSNLSDEGHQIQYVFSGSSDPTSFEVNVIGLIPLNQDAFTSLSFNGAEYTSASATFGNAGFTSFWNWPYAASPMTDGGTYTLIFS